MAFSLSGGGARAGLAILAGALATAMPLAAQSAAATGSAPPTEAQLQDATDTLSIFVSALNAGNVAPETKAGLLLCLYANPLGQLARGQAAALAANPKIDRKSPGQRLALIATMCRVPLAKAPAADARPAQPKK